eukprot:TRINITY_DN11671_c0_g1_i2.p1 TRINITY_DN11671_c0_g1~~TRINITY_DN11671_c0_g1_i2.p1  ORF type:complete len:2146 (-),score=402.71 TRINITY_DN11671_c0_g1_i2:84-5603(-)
MSKALQDPAGPRATNSRGSARGSIILPDPAGPRATNSRGSARGSIIMPDPAGPRATNSRGSARGSIIMPDPAGPRATNSRGSARGSIINLPSSSSMRGSVRGSVILAANVEKTKRGGDAACLLLNGNAAVKVSKPEREEATETEQFQPGVEFTPEVLSRRLPLEIGSIVRLIAADSGAEILRLPNQVLERVASEEEARESSRASACKALRLSTPASRTLQEWQAIYHHLKTHVAFFQDMSDDVIGRACQQAELIEIPLGGSIIARGSQPDGLRVLLQGTATVCRQEGDTQETGTLLPRPLQCPEAWFCEDDVLGEWELSFEHGSHTSVADIVAAEEGGCRVLFIPRAQYKQMLPQHSEALRKAALQALCVNSRASPVEHRLGLLCPQSPLLLAEEARQLQQARQSDDSGSEAEEKQQLQADEQKETDIAAVREWSHAVVHTAVGGMLGGHGEGLSGLSSDGNGAWKVPLLQLLPHHSRMQLHGKVRLWRASRGEILFKEGEQATSLMLLIQGEVGLFKEDRKTGSRTGSDVPTELLGNLPSLARHHLWRHGILRSHSARQWLFEVGSSEAQEPDPSSQGSKRTGYDKVIAALLESAARRWKGLPSPLLGSAPSSAELRRFLSNAWLDGKLLEEEAWWNVEQQPRKAHKRGSALFRSTAGQQVLLGETFLDVLSMGRLVSVLSEGVLGSGAPGAPREIPSQARTAVALSASADILVFDSAAVQEIISGLEPQLFPTSVLTGALRRHGTQKRLPKDRYVLAKLLRRQQVFAELESRALSRLCDAMGQVSLSAGQDACLEGERATGFFQVLSGCVSAFARDASTGANSLVLELGQGGAFGEDVLLRFQEVYPYSVRADTDVELAWVDADLYHEVSSDKRGEVGARRKALEASSKANDDGRLDELGMQDLESLCQVLKASPLLRDLPPGEQLEVTKQATVMRVPEGGQIFEVHQEQLPFCVVLRGCVGEYAVADYEASRVLSEEDGAEKALLAEQERQLRQQQEELLIKQKEVQRLRTAVGQLYEEQRWKPLNFSLEERLRLHALRRRLAKVLEELGDQAPAEGVDMSNHPDSSDCRRGSGLSKSSSASLRSHQRTSNAEPQGRRDKKQSTGQLGTSVRSSHSVNSTANSPAADFSFLTAACIPEGDEGEGVEELTVDSDLLDTMDNSTIQYYEGDCFGGWSLQGETPETQEMSDTNSTPETPALFRAHDDVILLVITHAGYEHAMQKAEQARLIERGRLLREYLPTGTPEESIQRLIQCFKEESRPKGSVLVKQGQVSNTVWVITGGRCSCRGVATLQGTSGSLQDSAGGEEAQDGAAQVAPGASRGGLMPQQRGGKELGILEEGQFIGLTSCLFLTPEPLTITTASQEVRLLRADHVKFYHPKVIEGLKRLTRSKTSWHERRFEKLAELPAQLHDKTERMRSEMQQAQIPLVIDSPFLRRKEQAGVVPGMVNLEAVCKHFGNEVHPESEWITTPQERSFFVHMRLSNSSFEAGQSAELDESQHQASASFTANSRFGHYEPLMWKKFQDKHKVSDVTVSKVTQSQASPEGSAAVKSATPLSSSLPMPLNYSQRSSASASSAAEVSSPRGGRASLFAADKATAVSQHEVELKTMSRTFQVSSVEVRANERRALKAAAAKVPGSDAPPVVTSKEDIRDGKSFRSIARQKTAQLGSLDLDDNVNGQSSETPRSRQLTAPQDDEPLTARERRLRGHGADPLPPIGKTKQPDVQKVKQLPSQLRHARAKRMKFRPAESLVVSSRTRAPPPPRNTLQLEEVDTQHLTGAVADGEQTFGARHEDFDVSTWGFANHDAHGALHNPSSASHGGDSDGWGEDAIEYADWHDM